MSCRYLPVPVGARSLAAILPTGRLLNVPQWVRAGCARVYLPVPMACLLWARSAARGCSGPPTKVAGMRPALRPASSCQWWTSRPFIRGRTCPTRGRGYLCSSAPCVWTSYLCSEPTDTPSCFLPGKLLLDDRAIAIVLTCRFRSAVRLVNSRSSRTLGSRMSNRSWHWGTLQMCGKHHVRRRVKSWPTRPHVPS